MQSYETTRRVRRTVARYWPIAALLSLTACASDPEVRVVTRTEVVEKEVEVYVPLPAELTAPLPYPQALPDGFTEGQLWELVFSLYDVVDQANEDRSTAARITGE